MEHQNDSTTIPTWFNEPTSCFKSVLAKVPVTSTLATWLKGIINPTTDAELKRKKVVMDFRKSGDKKLKRNIPAFCPGALIKSRDSSLSKDERIESITGWMQFDIDAQDNPHIDSAEELRDALGNISYTAFCSVSTSGKGVWGLVKVKDTKHYKAHFEQLKLDYKSLGIVLDPTKGGNPTDLRYYTFDPNAYIATELRVYDRLSKSEAPERRKSAKPLDNTDNWEKVNELVSEVNQRGLDIAPDYDTYVKLAFSLANEFGENGRALFHLACEPSSKYNSKDADTKFTSCLRSKGSGITIGTFFHLCKEAMPI